MTKVDFTLHQVSVITKNYTTVGPSGCTFWGKKPWSRKKKILWQLGLLIGAPLGIGLVAGVAVPAIIFGLPVWVARRVSILPLLCENHV